jgi:hypothetical protein
MIYCQYLDSPNSSRIRLPQPALRLHPMHPSGGPPTTIRNHSESSFFGAAPTAPSGSS